MLHYSSRGAATAASRIMANISRGLTVFLCCAVGNGEAGRSPITTHMLDTSLGKPAAGVGVQLHRRCPGSTAAWQFVVQGTTDPNGRISDLLPPSNSIEPGVYR